MSGFGKARLGLVRDVLARHVELGTAPGAVALLARGGQTVVEAVGDYGRDTIFRIASMSKPVTAAAAMILVEECVLRLDDPVTDFVPELRGQAWRVARTILDTHPGAETIRWDEASNAVEYMI